MMTMADPKFPTPVLAPPYVDPFATPQVSVLPSGARRIFEVIVEAMAPRSESVQFGINAEVTNYAENFLFFLPPLLRRGFPLTLHLINLLGILYTRAHRPLTWIADPDDRLRALERMRDSPWHWQRELCKALRAIVMSGFYAHPKVKQAIGYEPEPFVDKLRAARNETYGKALERQPV